ncbi:hypothetical protein SAMN04489717_3648 [Actinopolymorpha singaporensis]|uniref:Uncharacterized protein n=1 Tax=Actinopolymorpha singaporensis TaxID=117157 RepID=A0A1H1UIN8_9ACTN|nr:hypothetical protein SAMN04489717_3648 [Actinopolymorpha singaporensis]
MEAIAWARSKLAQFVFISDPEQGGALVEV